MKKIREIKNSYKPINCQKIKVCAYARVSRDNLDAFHSLEAQKEYYTRLYKYSPDYEFIEAFCDFGISGIKESRPAFDEMLRRARNKEFDLIVTKSISRFARNILLLIKVIRELRDIGVAIFFEKEGINTMNIEGEMLLSIYGSVAEEERKQVSTNIKWSIQRQYLKGNPCLNFDKIFGYDEDFIINEEQAKTVRRVYNLYLKGANAEQIAGELRDSNTPYYFGKNWTGQRILRMISNPIYNGDLLMQKFFVDHRGKQVKNKGQVPQYIIEGHHVSIVSREIWDEAQTIRKEKLNMYGRSNYKKG